MTPAEVAAKLRGLRSAARISSDDVESMLEAWADGIAKGTAPEIAASLILIRANLCRTADRLEARAAELRAWAREIGEG